MTDFARARKTMVDNQIRTNGITDRRLLAALGDGSARGVRARGEAAAGLSRPGGGAERGARGWRRRRSLPSWCSLRRSTAPTTCSISGCGSGYSSAVLARLAGSVVAVEDETDARQRGARNAVAARRNRRHGARRGARDGGQAAWPLRRHRHRGHGVGGGGSLFAQLKPEGRLVAPSPHRGRCRWRICSPARARELRRARPSTCACRGSTREPTTPSCSSAEAMRAAVPPMRARQVLWRARGAPGKSPAAKRCLASVARASRDL